MDVPNRFQWGFHKQLWFIKRLMPRLTRSLITDRNSKYRIHSVDKSMFNSSWFLECIPENAIKSSLWMVQGSSVDNIIVLSGARHKKLSSNEDFQQPFTWRKHHYTTGSHNKTKWTFVCFHRSLTYNIWPFTEFAVRIKNRIHVLALESSVRTQWFPFFFLWNSSH